MSSREQPQPPDVPHLDDIHRERWELLERIDEITAAPMVALSFIWLALLVLEFTSGISTLLQTISNVIWGLFIIDFGIGFTIAPRKVDYLRRNWLTVVSLLLPALRIFRIVRVVSVLRAARAARSLSLIRLITSMNRGMRALGNVLGRRGIGYVVALTVLVTFAGAAGMFLFERDVATNSTGLNSYGEAVWWTAMIMTTLGSEYWPKTAEGRMLAWLLSLYAFAIFGYITATIASYFVGQDTATQTAASAAQDDAAALRAEMAALRAQLALLTERLEQPQHASMPRDKRAL